VRSSPSSVTSESASTMAAERRASCRRTRRDRLIRPEDMEDAALAADAPADRRITATPDVCEAIGPEIFVHFTLNAPPVVTDHTRDLAADSGDTALEALQQQVTRFVARVNRHTVAREGEPMQLLIDTTALHFFDPATGEAVY
jgi:multiple sugar transport system ATP-binding protein